MDYRLILDNAPLPILVIQDERVVYCNASGFEILRYAGYDVDEHTIGEFDLTQIMPETERQEASNSLAALLQGDGPLRNIPRTLTDAKGQPIQTLTSASLVQWEGRPAVEVSYIIVGLYPQDRAQDATLPSSQRSASLRDARASAFTTLTSQETRVSVLIAEGLKTADIAQRLGIRDSTLRGYIKNVYRKLGVHSRAELVRRLLGHR